MIKRDFRTVGKTEVKMGLAIWLDGRFFEDTNPIGPKPNDDLSPVCGPFLVERISFRNFQGIREPRVDLVYPETGRRRSMFSSWLLVPKEKL